MTQHFVLSIGGSHTKLYLVLKPNYACLKRPLKGFFTCVTCKTAKFRVTVLGNVSK